MNNYYSQWNDLNESDYDDDLDFDFENEDTPSPDEEDDTNLDQENDDTKLYRNHSCCASGCMNCLGFSQRDFF